ncbi:ArsR/SmtB family transcription factor [Modestobacter sp. URMC 112]
MSNPVAVTFDDERLDAMFAALADRTRRDIVARLSEGEATVTELAAPYAMSLQAVSQHIGVLERCGLVSRGRHRQTRPCRLEPQALEAAVSFIEDSRRTWAERMDRLEAHLARVQDGGPR